MSRKIIVVTEKPFASEAVDLIKEAGDAAGYQVDFFESYKDKSELINKVPGYEGMIIRSDIIDRDVINAADDLRIIVRAGAGYDNVDLESASSRDIVVMNTPGQNSNAVAELALGMMVMMARNKYNGKSGTELKGKKLGIHAYGNVGKYVAAIAKGFGMEIYAYDPFIEDDVIRKDGITPVSSAVELYSKCQYISLHIPSNAETKGSIGFELLSKLAPGAALVNTARKEVINEAELLRVFSEREDFVYMSDIAPDNAEEINEKFGSRAFFTPKKMGAQTAEANINAGVAAINQIVGFFEKGDTAFQVNK